METEQYSTELPIDQDRNYRLPRIQVQWIPKLIQRGKIKGTSY